MRHAHYSELDTEAFGHWLAGFIDGEGCFAINRWKDGGKVGYYCLFQIGLRDDDAPILEEIQRRTDLGRIRAKRSRKPNEGGQSVWAIHSKQGCMDLVQLLDRFPLRAKKRHDYTIWREAVIYWRGMKPAWIGTGSGRRGITDWSYMSELRDRLRQGRTYDHTGDGCPNAGQVVSSGIRSRLF